MPSRVSAPAGGLGIDVGGSSVRAGRYRAGELQVAARPIGRDTDLPAFIEALRDVVAETGDDFGPAVIALPTFIHPDGRLDECPSVPALSGTRLADLIGRELRRPAPQLVPDLAAAAVAEGRSGVGAGVDRFVCVALGTGANAAAINSGRIVDTAFGCLGDAGHVVVDPLGPPCACGGAGCLESICSGAALGQRARELGFADAKALAGAALAGDEAAREEWWRAGSALGRAIATWSALLWPQVVAVAGGLSRAGELLLEPARREFSRHCPPYIAKDVSIVPAALGEQATLVGAILLAG